MYTEMNPQAATYNSVLAVLENTTIEDCGYAAYDHNGVFIGVPFSGDALRLTQK